MSFQTDPKNINLLSIKCLQVIKRKEQIFKPQVAQYKKAHAILSKSRLLDRLDRLARVLINYAPNDVLILSTSADYKTVLDTLASFCKFRVITRYRRGLFNNTMQNGYLECRVLFTCHDRRDRCAITDAKKQYIKIAGFTNLARGYRYYDYPVYANTFSKEAMVVYSYLLYKRIRELTGENLVTFEEFSAHCV